MAHCTRAAAVSGRRGKRTYRLGVVVGTAVVVVVVGRGQFVVAIVVVAEFLQAALVVAVLSFIVLCAYGRWKVAVRHVEVSHQCGKEGKPTQTQTATAHGT
jgi:hypothetical protein